MLRQLDDRLADHLVLPARAMGDTIELVTWPASLPLVMRSVREDGDLRFEVLADMCGVDTGLTMQVVYHLWSPLSSDWLRVIADGLSRDDPRVPSITFLWPGAEWAEREAYDMFGIEFEGNRDLRRIYMPPDYRAFPLRKDFALADDASRAPGEGIRHMETPFAPGDVRRQPVIRHSPGAGALIGPDGERLSIAPGRSIAADGGVATAELEGGEAPA
jgi:NADH-quinone oxidoreductase subunit C